MVLEERGLIPLEWKIPLSNILVQMFSLKLICGICCLLVSLSMTLGTLRDQTLSHSSSLQSCTEHSSTCQESISICYINKYVVGLTFLSLPSPHSLQTKQTEHWMSLSLSWFLKHFFPLKRKWWSSHPSSWMALEESGPKGREQVTTAWQELGILSLSHCRNRTLLCTSPQISKPELPHPRYQALPHHAPERSPPPPPPASRLQSTGS